jgi:hypothetical protein
MADITNIPAPVTGSPAPQGLDGAIDKAFSANPLAPAAPEDPYANDQKLLEVFKTLKEECLEGRSMFERLWWRNILYLLGRQWIYYDKRRGQWMDKRLAKWMPRPVTNKISEAVETLVSLFGGIKLATTVKPIGGSVKNVAAAEIADEIEPYIADEHEMKEVFRDADFWLVVTGNAILHPHWNKDDQRGTVMLPTQKCAACGSEVPEHEMPQPDEAGAVACPVCQGTAWDPQGGLPVQKSLGRGRTFALSPLEVAVPPIYKNFDDSPVLLQMGWTPKRTLEQTYGKDFIKDLRFSSSPSERSLQMMRALGAQTDISNVPTTWSWGSQGDQKAEGIETFRLWVKPNKEFPKGLFMVVLGNGTGAKVLRDENESCPGPLPYASGDGEPIWPWIHIAFKPVGGRLWAGGPLDLIIQKQDQINQLDAMTQLIIQRMSNPIWLEPKGADVTSFTGEPGLIVKYNPLTVGGAKPERIAGENIPPTLFQLRQQYLADLEQLSGTFDVLKGAKPAGVEAFSTLQLLVERGQSRFATVFNERGSAYRKWYSVALELERQYGPDERIVSVVSPNKRWTFKHFERAKLQGDIDIVVEDGTQAPKTNLGRRAAIEQANNLKVINGQDPEQRYQILQELGLSELLPSLDADVKASLQEQDAFEEWIGNVQANPAILQQIEMQVQQYSMGLQQYQEMAQQLSSMPPIIDPMTGAATPPPAPPPPPEPPQLTPFQWKKWNNDMVHLTEHAKWANSDSARELFQQFPMLEQCFTWHLEKHEFEIQKKMPPGGIPAPQKVSMSVGVSKGAGAAQAMNNSNRESGNPADVPQGNGPRGPR